MHVDDARVAERAHVVHLPAAGRVEERGVENARARTAVGRPAWLRGRWPRTRSCRRRRSKGVVVMGGSPGMRIEPVCLAARWRACESPRTVLGRPGASTSSPLHPGVRWRRSAPLVLDPLELALQTLAARARGRGSRHGSRSDVVRGGRGLGHGDRRRASRALVQTGGMFASARLDADARCGKPCARASRSTVGGRSQSRRSTCRSTAMGESLGPSPPCARSNPFMSMSMSEVDSVAKTVDPDAVDHRARRSAKSKS